jgi:hypothetical protein
MSKCDSSIHGLPIVFTEYDVTGLKILQTTRLYALAVREY